MNELLADNDGYVCAAACQPESSNANDVWVSLRVMIEPGWRWVFHLVFNVTVRHTATVSSCGRRDDQTIDALHGKQKNRVRVSESCRGFCGRERFGHHS
jgi:hypothetical protein